MRSRVTSPSVATTAVRLPMRTQPKKGVSVREKATPKNRKSPLGRRVPKVEVPSDLSYSELSYFNYIPQYPDWNIYSLLKREVHHSLFIENFSIANILKSQKCQFCIIQSLIIIDVQDLKN